ncbi:hypothetical protein Tco_0060798 [Tanacetum coccineum]
MGTTVTKLGQVPINTAKQSSPRVAASISIVRPVNTAAPKPKVNGALPTTYSYFKAHSPVIRAFNRKSAAKTNNLNEKVKIVRVNNVTTVGPKAIVSVIVGNRENVVKSLACWIWRPTGNVIDHTSKDSGSYMFKRFDYVDLQGRLKHMTGIKSFLTDYQEVDGGFVAFARIPKGDETVYKEWEDRMERAATTASSLEAEQDNGNINRTQSMATLNESFPQGTDSGSGPRCQDTILGVQKLKLVNVVRLNLLLPALVYAVRHTLTAVRHKLMLSGITCYCWTSAKVKIVNGERQIQALVDKKKVIITKTSIRSDLKLDDAKGIDCLPTAIIFAELERMGAKTTAWNEFSSTMASCAPTEPVTDEAHVSTPSYDLPQRGEDSMQLSELMNLCTSLQEKVLDLEKVKTAQAKEITSLKKRVK